MSRKTRSAEDSKRAEAPGTFLSDVTELRRRASRRGAPGVDL